MFYMISNKHNDKLGFYMIRICEFDPGDHKFLMKLVNGLQIGDANIFLLRNEEFKYKELLISYKTIYLNT